MYKMIRIRALNIPCPIQSIMVVSTYSKLQTSKNPIEEGAMEGFINTIIENNQDKWKKLEDDVMKKHVKMQMYSSNFVRSVRLLSKSLDSDLSAIQHYKLNINVGTLPEAQLDSLLQSTIKVKNKVDFLYIIKQCIQWERLPSSEVLTACLEYLSILSKVQIIKSLTVICEKQKHPLLQIYVDLEPFKAMALWHSGGCNTSLTNLYDGYVKNLNSNDGKRMVRSAFRTIIEDCLRQKGDAILHCIIKIGYRLLERHNDIFVIASLWKECFSSEWFCDQQLAGDVFETCTDLRKLVAQRSKSICTSLLDESNMNAVHRLIEIFIQYEEPEAYSNCLSLLFTYQYLRGNVRACTEIVKSCNNLNITLNGIQAEQFIQLLLNKGGSMLSLSKVISKKHNNCNKFQYKF